MAVREAAQPPEHLKVIDSDAFFTEPHDLWTRRAPAHLRERVPQVKMVDGRASWVIDGNKPLGRGSNPGSAIGKDGTKAVGRGYQSLEREDVLRASYDLEARLALMDEAGIRAQIIYPNLLGFGGQHMFGFGGQRSAEVDPQLKLACVQIYNDAMAELQQRSSQRLFPMALVPWWDVRLAAEEAARAAGLGLRGINMHSDPHWYRGKVEKTLSDLAHPDWDPLWEVCCERNLPVNFHIGASEQGSTDWYANQWPTARSSSQAAVRIGGKWHWLDTVFARVDRLSLSRSRDGLEASPAPLGIFPHELPCVLLVRAFEPCQRNPGCWRRQCDVRDELSSSHLPLSPRPAYLQLPRPHRGGAAQGSQRQCRQALQDSDQLTPL
jgi:predicted TIM-barrel fold metal-dependent hydrolase